MVSTLMDPTTKIGPSAAAWLIEEAGTSPPCVSCAAHVIGTAATLLHVSSTTSVKQAYMGCTLVPRPCMRMAHTNSVVCIVGMQNVACKCMMHHQKSQRHAANLHASMQNLHQ